MLSGRKIVHLKRKMMILGCCAFLNFVKLLLLHVEEVDRGFVAGWGGCDLRRLLWAVCSRFFQAEVVDVGGFAEDHLGFVGVGVER